MPLTRAASRKHAEKMRAEATLVSLTPQACHPQPQSPLFGILPGELRQRIAEYALVQYEDLTQQYDKNNHYYRPGYRAPHRLDIGLLQTCKMFYLEARHLPLANASFTFWYESIERGPPGRYHESVELLFSNLPGGRANTVQVFAQLYWLEGLGLTQMFQDRDDRPIRPRNFVITVRHTDWWWWENDQPLQMQDEDWVTSWRVPHSVEKLCIQFEAPRRKRAQLDAFVAHAIEDWTFTQDASPVCGRMSARNSQPIVSSWTGSARFYGRNYEPLIDRQPPSEQCEHDQSDDVVEATESTYQPEEIDYDVLTVTWRPVRTDKTAMS